MTGKVKGCGNETCEAQKKKIKFNKSETFCSKCGRPLVYVCNECYTPVSNETEKYCIRCLAKHEDRNDKVKKTVGVVLGAGVPGGFIIHKYGKKALNGAEIIIGLLVRMKK